MINLKTNKNVKSYKKFDFLVTHSWKILKIENINSHNFVLIKIYFKLIASKMWHHGKGGRDYSSVTTYDIGGRGLKTTKFAWYN